VKEFQLALQQEVAKLGYWKSICFAAAWGLARQWRV